MKIKNTSFGSNPFKRGVAVITMVLFLSMELLNHAPTVFAQSIGSKVQGGNPSEHLHRLGSDREIRIPPELGLIDESFQGTSGKTIFYIQDAHDSLEAQENISKIINQLVASYGVKTVFEEGYEGPVPTDKYFGFIKDAKIKEKVSYFLMDHLRVGGAEYAHINRIKDFSLIGADSLKLHKENIDQYRLSAAKKDVITKDIKALEKELKSLVDSRFPKEIKTWLKIKEQFDAKKLDLFSYLGRTMPLLGKRGTENGLGLISFILEAIRSSDPAVIEKAKHIDAREVFSELIKLEHAVAETCLHDGADKQLFEYYEILRLLRRLNDLQVSQEEYESVKASLKAFDTDSFARFIFSQAPKTLILSRMWERNIKDAIRFYEIAAARDGAISNAFGKYFSGQYNEAVTQDTAVLVYGGFHKENIKRILEAKGISYLVVSPRITKPSSRHEQFYKQLMDVGRLSYELPANLRIATRSESRIEIWDANPMLAKAELRIMEKVARDMPSIDPQTLGLIMERALAYKTRSETRADQPVSGVPGIVQAEVRSDAHEAATAENLADQAEEESGKKQPVFSAEELAKGGMTIIAERLRLWNKETPWHVAHKELEQKFATLLPGLDFSSVEVWRGIVETIRRDLVKLLGSETHPLFLLTAESVWHAIDWLNGEKIPLAGSPVAATLPAPDPFFADFRRTHFVIDTADVDLRPNEKITLKELLKRYSEKYSDKLPDPETVLCLVQENTPEIFFKADIDGITRLDEKIAVKKGDAFWVAFQKPALRPQGKPAAASGEETGLGQLSTAEQEQYSELLAELGRHLRFANEYREDEHKEKSEQLIEKWFAAGRKERLTNVDMTRKLVLYFYKAVKELPERDYGGTAEQFLAGRELLKHLFARRGVRQWLEASVLEMYLAGQHTRHDGISQELEPAFILMLETLIVAPSEEVVLLLIRLIMGADVAWRLKSPLWRMLLEGSNSEVQKAVSLKSLASRMGNSLHGSTGWGHFNHMLRPEELRRQNRDQKESRPHSFYGAARPVFLEVLRYLVRQIDRQAMARDSIGRDHKPLLIQERLAETVKAFGDEASRDIFQLLLDEKDAALRDRLFFFCTGPLESKVHPKYSEPLRSLWQETLLQMAERKAFPLEGDFGYRISEQFKEAKPALRSRLARALVPLFLEPERKNLDEVLYIAQKLKRPELQDAVIEQVFRGGRKVATKSLVTSSIGYMTALADPARFDAVWDFAERREKDGPQDEATIAVLAEYAAEMLEKDERTPCLTPEQKARLADFADRHFRKVPVGTDDVATALALQFTGLLGWEDKTAEVVALAARPLKEEFNAYRLSGIFEALSRLSLPDAIAALTALGGRCLVESDTAREQLFKFLDVPVTERMRFQKTKLYEAVLDMALVNQLRPVFLETMNRFVFEFPQAAARFMTTGRIAGADLSGIKFERVVKTSDLRGEDEGGAVGTDESGKEGAGKESAAPEVKKAVRAWCLARLDAPQKVKALTLIDSEAEFWPRVREKVAEQLLEELGTTSTQMERGPVQVEFTGLWDALIRAGEAQMIAEEEKKARFEVVFLLKPVVDLQKLKPASGALQPLEISAVVDALVALDTSFYEPLRAPLNRYLTWLDEQGILKGDWDMLLDRFGRYFVTGKPVFRAGEKVTVKSVPARIDKAHLAFGNKHFYPDKAEPPIDAAIRSVFLRLLGTLWSRDIERRAVIDTTIVQRMLPIFQTIPAGKAPRSEMREDQRAVASGQSSAADGKLNAGSSNRSEMRDGKQADSPQPTAHSQTPDRAMAVLEQEFQKFGMRLIDGKIDFTDVPLGVDWVMDNLREEQDAPIVTQLDKIPTVELWDKVSPDEFPSLPRVGGSHRLDLVLIRTGGRIIPAVLKYLYKVRDPNLIDTIGTAWVSGQKGISPKLYGLVRDKNGLIEGYAEQLVIGEWVPTSDIAPVWMLRERFNERQLRQYREIKRRALEAGLKGMTDYMITRTDGLVLVDSEDVEPTKGFLEQFGIAVPPVNWEHAYVEAPSEVTRLPGGATPFDREKVEVDGAEAKPDANPRSESRAMAAIWDLLLRFRNRKEFSFPYRAFDGLDELISRVKSRDIRKVMVVGDSMPILVMILSLLGKDVYFVDQNRFATEEIKKDWEIITKEFREMGFAGDYRLTVIPEEIGALDIGKNGLQENSFDMVTYIDLAWNFQGDPKQWFQTARKLLKPDGYVVYDDMIRYGSDHRLPVLKAFEEVFPRAKAVPGRNILGSYGFRDGTLGSKLYKIDGATRKKQTRDGRRSESRDADRSSQPIDHSPGEESRQSSVLGLRSENRSDPLVAKQDGSARAEMRDESDHRLPTTAPSQTPEPSVRFESSGIRTLRFFEREEEKAIASAELRDFISGKMMGSGLIFNVLLDGETLTLGWSQSGAHDAIPVPYYANQDAIKGITSMSPAKAPLSLLPSGGSPSDWNKYTNDFIRLARFLIENGYDPEKQIEISSLGGRFDRKKIITVGDLANLPLQIEEEANRRSEMRDEIKMLEAHQRQLVSNLIRQYGMASRSEMRGKSDDSPQATDDSQTPDRTMVSRTLSIGEVKQIINALFSAEEIAGLWHLHGEARPDLYDEVNDKHLLASLWRPHFQQALEESGLTAESFMRTMQSGGLSSTQTAYFRAPIKKENVIRANMPSVGFDDAVKVQIKEQIQLLAEEGNASGRMEVGLGGTSLDEIKVVVEMIDGLLKEIASELAIKDVAGWIKSWNINIRAFSIDTAALMEIHKNLVKQNIIHRDWLRLEYIDLLDAHQWPRLRQRPFNVFFVSDSLDLGNWPHTRDGRFYGVTENSPKMPRILQFVQEAHSFVHAGGIFVTEVPPHRKRPVFQETPLIPGFNPEYYPGQSIRTGVYVKEDRTMSSSPSGMDLKLDANRNSVAKSPEAPVSERRAEVRVGVKSKAMRAEARVAMEPKETHADIAEKGSGTFLKQQKASQTPPGIRKAVLVLEEAVIDGLSPEDYKKLLVLVATERSKIRLVVPGSEQGGYNARVAELSDAASVSYRLPEAARFGKVPVFGFANDSAAALKDRLNELGENGKGIAVRIDECFALEEGIEGIVLALLNVPPEDLARKKGLLYDERGLFSSQVHAFIGALVCGFAVISRAA